ncbi:MAG: hypothetical protein ACOZHQ_14235 [Thermodesulfobacteriota bacterium]
MPPEPRSAPPPGVVLLPINGPSWHEMHWLALSLAESGLARPLVLVVERCAALPRATDERIAYHELAEAGPAGPGPLARRLRGLAQRVGGQRATLPWDHALQRARLADHLAQLEAVLAEFDPVLAVLLGDRQYAWELPLMGLCRRRGMKVLLPPISYPGDRDDLTAIRRGPRLDAEAWPGLRRRFPGQCATDRQSGRRVWFYEPAAMLAAHGLNLLPPDPWALGSNGVDLILADGENTRARLVAAGGDPRKITVCGHRGHDELFAGLQRRHALRQELAPGAVEGQWLVASLPPLGEANLCDWDRAWRETRFLAAALSQAAAAHGLTALISLHPKMDPARYQFLNGEFGLTVCARPLAEILPAADLFVAPQGSTTIQWAVLCGVPALALDLYGLNLDLYADREGVAIIREPAELAPALARLAGDEAHRQAMAAAQRRDRAGLSPFDGRCGQRILAAAAGLLRRGAPEPSAT